MSRVPPRDVAPVPLSGIGCLVRLPGHDRRPEASVYAGQFIQAFKDGGVGTALISIGVMARPGSPIAGLEVVTGMPDAARFLEVMTGAGLSVGPSPRPLPVPGSMASRYSGFVGLIVGPKP